MYEEIERTEEGRAVVEKAVKALLVEEAVMEEAARCKAPDGYP